MAVLTDKVAIGYLNRAEGKTITPSSSASGYPASNLNHPSMFSTTWRSATGSLTGQNLDVDLGSSQDIEIIALLGSNITDTGTVTPVTSDSSTFASPEYNPGSIAAFDLTYPALLSDTPRYGRHIIILPPATYNSRYVRVTQNNANNPSNYQKASVYWVGPIWQPDTGLDYDFEPLDEFVGIPGLETYIRSWRLTLKSLTESKSRQLLSILRNKLRSGRYLLVPHPTVRSTFIHEAIYCTLISMRRVPVPMPPEEDLTSPYSWNIEVVFREVED